MIRSQIVEKRARAVPDYQAFIKSLKLYLIGLAESSCRLNRENYWEGDEEKQIKYTLTSQPITIQQKHFDVRSTLKLTVSSEKAKAPVLLVSSTFELYFHAAPADKAFVEQFCKSEIRLIVWPYFREYVTELTARMHIPPVILPLSDKEEKEEA